MRTPSNSGTIHNLPFGLRSFTKPEVALQTTQEAVFNGSVTDKLTLFLALGARHFRLHKAHKPEGKILDHETST